ncbi:MAG: hypothetical protein MJZ75_03185 [Paludibacteraceae bacterium]|nr:hypothetical protein [Paludibacteraceae bacterium]
MLAKHYLRAIVLLWISSMVSVLHAQTTIQVKDSVCFGSPYRYEYEGVLIYENNNVQWTFSDSRAKTINQQTFYFYFNITCVQTHYTLETHEIEEVEGATFDWHGKTYTQPGVYLDTVSYYPQGCPKEIVILSLNGFINGAVCNGVPFVTPGGASYNYAVTNYQRYIQWVAIGGIGFNTYERINVVVGKPTSSKTKVTITDGDSYTWFGKEYTRQGTYHDTIANAVGCDSIGTLILGVCSNALDTGKVSATIFKGDYFYYQGEKYTTETHKVLKYTTEYGCDSVVKLDVEVLTLLPGYESHSMCEGDSYDWHGQHITEPGQYTDGDDILLVSVLPIPHVNAGDEVVISHGETVTLHATGADYYEWRADPTLSGTTSPNPEASPKTTTTYYVKSRGSMDDDLVINGDFSAGNTNFTTDGRETMDCASQECCGTFMILPSTEVRGWSGPYDWQQKTNQFDHTVGDETGAYMIWDGFMDANRTIWQQTVTVQPNTDYVFSAWLTSLFSSFDWAYTQFQFCVNGAQLGAVTEAPHKEGVWGQYYEIWSSGTNTTAILTIKNQNSGYEGNDFGLDDISFRAIGQCHGNDSVTVIVNFDVHLYPSCGHTVQQRAAHEVAGMTDRTVTFSVPGYCSDLSGIYLEGDRITVYAHDEECRVFSHWSDGNTDNPRIFTVGKSNLAVQAVYAGDLFTVTAAQIGEGTVTGGQKYLCHDIATVTATPADCWSFVQWKEDGNTNPVRTFEVTEERTLTAVFEPLPYLITVHTQTGNTAQGTVTAKK